MDESCAHEQSLRQLVFHHDGRHSGPVVCWWLHCLSGWYFLAELPAAIDSFDEFQRSLQMIDDPDSMTEKPAAFGGRQSDFVKETLFGKGWLLTWRWIPHSIVHAIHVFDGWIYHDLPFF